MGFGTNFLVFAQTSMYLDERRGVQENTSMRLGHPEGTSETDAGIFLYSPTLVKVQTLFNL